MGWCGLAGGIQGTCPPDCWAGGQPVPAAGLCGCWDGAGLAGAHPRDQPSAAAQSRAVSSSPSPSKPRHCPGSGLSAGAACKETCEPERLLRAGPGGRELRVARPTPVSRAPKPRRVRPSPARERVGAEPRDRESPFSGVPHGSSGRGGGGRGRAGGSGCRRRSPVRRAAGRWPRGTAWSSAGTRRRQVPTLPRSPARSPLGTHIDTGGIEGALAGGWGKGDVGDGAGAQQRPALGAQRQPDGDGQPQQAGQAAQAAAGAQGENHPFLREQREEAARRARAVRGRLSRPPPRGQSPSEGTRRPCVLHGTAAACWVLGEGCGAGGAYEGGGGEVAGQREGGCSTGDGLRGSEERSGTHGTHPPQGHGSPFPADVAPESSPSQFGIGGGQCFVSPSLHPVTMPCAFNPPGFVLERLI